MWSRRHFSRYNFQSCIIFLSASAVFSMNLPYIYIESYVVTNELLKPILRGRKSDLRENQKKKSSCNKKNDELKVGKSKCSKPEDNMVEAGQENQAVNISVDECNSPKRFQKDTILPFKAKSKSSEINRKHKRRSGMLAHVSNLFQMFI